MHKLKRYWIKTNVTAAERVWDFATNNKLQMYPLGHIKGSLYQYEVHMTDVDFVAFKLTITDAEISVMRDKPEVDDLMVTHYICVPESELIAYITRIKHQLGDSCVVDKVTGILRRNTRSITASVKVVMLEGSEEENIFLLTYGHLTAK